jgi:hypothetical protein
VKSKIGTLGPTSLLRALPNAGLAALAVLALLLSSCEAVRFPGMTPQPTSSPGGPGATPTIAPMLLTPAASNTPSPPGPVSSASPTPTFGLPPPQPTCAATPMWGLGDVWRNDAVRRRLGCATGDQLGVEGEEVYFQSGHMLWRPAAGLIYVLFAIDQPDGWGAFVDSFQPGDPDTDPAISASTSASAGTVYDQPTGRFGKLWRENPRVRERLGWAVKQTSERNAPSMRPFAGAAQDFQGGALLWNGKTCFVLRTDDMSWTMY